MAEYKLYLLDHNDKIMRREDHDLVSDQAARDKAYELDHAHAIEIWEGKRIVTRVYPDAAFGRGNDAMSGEPRSD